MNSVNHNSSSSALRVFEGLTLQYTYTHNTHIHAFRNYLVPGNKPWDDWGYFQVNGRKFFSGQPKSKWKGNRKKSACLENSKSQPPFICFFFFLWHIYKFSSLCLCTPLILYLTFKQWHTVSLDTYCGPVISMLMTDFIFGFWRNVQIYPFQTELFHRAPLCLQLIFSFIIA